jgi:hypothetical protein
MKDVIKYKGLYIFYTKNMSTGKIEHIETVENIITDITLSYLIVALKGLNPVTYNYGIDIRQLAIGTGTTAPTATDTKLVTEVYRVPRAAQTITAAGELTTEFYISDNEYTGSIKEVGVYGGYRAYDWLEGLNKDLGNLMSRALWDYTKSDSEQIIIQRVDRLARG